MRTVDFLKGLLIKAGLNPADEKYKPFLDTAEFATVEVPAEIQTGIDTSLISLSEAKNNFGPLKNHYTALALNGFDTRIDELTNEWELEENDRNELKIEKNTGKRMELLLKKQAALQQKKFEAGKPDQKALNDKLTELNNQIRIEKTRSDAAEVNFKKTEKELRLDFELSSLLAGYKTIYDTLSPKTRNATIKTIIKMDLQDKKAKIDYDDQGNTVLLSADGSAYFGENNAPVNISQFIEQSLSKNKLVAVTPPAGQQQTGSSQQSGQQTQNGSQQRNINGNTGDGKTVVGQNPVFQELMGNAKKDFNNINGVVQKN